ncbi:MAG: PAS-domain containing protein [Rubrivivax sp.]|nr:PAS-domain containing protein [Rubrivivax sp.]
MAPTHAAPPGPTDRAPGVDLLQLVFDHAGEGISVFDAELRLLAWNQRFLDFTGLPPSLAVPGAPLQALLHTMALAGEFGPVDAEVEVARRLAALRDQPASVTQRVRPGGRSIELRRYPTPGGGFVMLYADVTERVQAETQLRQTSTLLAQKSNALETTLQNLSQGVLTIDASGRITAWNRRALDLLELSDEVMRSHTTLESLGRYQLAHGLIDVSAFTGQGRPPLYQRTRRDGLVVEVRTSLSEDGSVVRTYTDVTASVQAQRALAESESRFRTLADAAPALIWMAGADGKPTWFNQRWLQQTGRSLEAELACAWPERIPAEDLQACRAAYAAAAPQRVAYEVEYRLRHADGSLRWIADKGIPRVAADGSFDGYIVYGWDITERKATEAALRAAKDEAERANRAKSDFLSRMSHELRTPLNAVLGFAQLLQSDADDPLSATQQPRVHELMRGGRHLLSLINEVLDLARIEAGALQLQLGPVDLQPLVDDCLPLVQAMAEARGITLLLRAPPPGGCRVLADPTRLRQVLLNLLSNAIKYNRPAGRVELSWRADTDTGMVHIEVQDTGFGIAPAQQSRLFQAFERLDADQTEVEGAGIGLALSKWLVDLMRGTIGLHSTPGQGSTFWVHLHCADTAAEAPGTLAATEVTPAGAAPAAARLHTVLYIEDNAVNQLLMEGMLAQRPGVRLLIAGLPETGLVMATQARPDLVLLDIQLPGIDGFEVLRRLRAQDSTRHIPVVAVSANAMQSDLDDARRAGFADYVTKPLDLKRLLTVVDGLLGAAGAA